MPLMPDLLGSAFDALDAPLRAVHRGASGEWRGTATVRHGRSPLARMACTLGGLPPEADHVPIIVSFEVAKGQERWIRRYGTARPMSSRLWRSGSLLVEQLGVVRTSVDLTVQYGELHWQGVKMSILGIPLPRRAFDVVARISAAGAAYCFEVTVRLAGVGELIHYEGRLDVSA